MNILTVRDDQFPFSIAVATVDDDTPQDDFPDAEWVEEAFESLEIIESEESEPESEWLEEARRSFLRNNSKYITVKTVKPSLS